MVEYVFLQPEGGIRLGGGGAYTRGLIAALRQAGHGAETIEGIAAPAGKIAVVDGLNLAAIAREVAPQAVGLIHHFSVLPGADLLPQFRRVIATSAPIAERLVGEFGVAGERITVVTPGVPDAARSAGSGGGHCEILTIGACVPRKNHGLLIHALLKLLDLDWRLTIVGSITRDPATAAALQTLAEPAGGRVRFAGPLDHATLDGLWHGADLFALASAWEGYPAAVAESLRRGIPVAVTAGTAGPELVSPQTGVICEAGSSVQLSRSLRRLIYDTELRAAMADAAWQAGRALPNWAQQAELFAAATA